MTEEKTLLLSKSALIKSTVAALILSSIVLLLFILPAEYNLDLTGLGKKMGLTQLAPDSANNADKVINTTTVNNDNSHNNGYQKDQVTIEIEAGEGLEYKFYLQKNKVMTYYWSTNNGAELYFDLHGEPEGDTTGYFESYAISNSNEIQGSFITPFVGSHGWYWKNNGDTKVSLTLNTEGEYKVIGLVN